MRISDWSSDVCSSDLWLDSKQKSGPRTAYFNLAGVAWQPARLRLRGNVGWSGAGTEIYAYLNYIDGVEDRRTLPYRDGSRSEEHTSELQSLMRISYAVFCLKKKNTNTKQRSNKKDNKE